MRVGRIPAVIAAVLVGLLPAATAALPASAAVRATAAVRADAEPAAPLDLGLQAPPDCADYEFIAARGSGEDNGLPTKTRYTTQNLGMGGELHGVYTKIAKSLDRVGLTIAPFGVPYPAIGVDQVGGLTLGGGDGGDGGASAYLKSVELGAHAATAELERVHRDCPDTGVIIGGYSQGAQVIVDAVVDAAPAARASIRATVLFGSTYFTASDTTDDFGSYAPDLDGYLVDPSETEKRSEAFAGIPVFDYCHDGDPICGLVDQVTVDGVDYPVRDFAHIVAAATAAGSAVTDVFSQHTTYVHGDTANATAQLRLLLGLTLAPVTNAPTARISTDTTPEAGQPTRFNAGGTLSDPGDPVVQYRWTVRGPTTTDGTDPGPDDLTVSTATPVLSMTFTQPGAHTVGLAVRTRDGRTSGATVTVAVLEAPTDAPPAVGEVQASPGDGTATLSWAAVPDAAFYAVRDGDGTLLTAFTPLVSGQPTVSWTDTGLKNGRERQYRVYAVNTAGPGSLSPLVPVTPTAAPDGGDAAVAVTPAVLPLGLPPGTLVDPELVWAIGLGLIVLVIATALSTSRRGRSTPARGPEDTGGTSFGGRTAVRRYGDMAHPPGTARDQSPETDAHPHHDADLPVNN